MANIIEHLVVNGTTYDLGTPKIVACTQEEYDAMSEHDENTYYMIKKSS